ncbi:MAG TPA: methyltransferase domain-containing protein [Opitutaceae bacterium]|nr:methyltransferase domain-containing protein [Opitutaceae bacterium]
MDSPSAQSLPDKIQYGCGQNVFEGWLNVDGFKSYYAWHAVPQAVQEKIHRMELLDRHPFPDDSFRFGFAEDFLEHLDQAESLIFLSEAYRCLKPGGVLRLSFPGLEGVLRRHYRGTHHEGAVTGFKEAYEMWHHKHFYSAASLETVARHLGFSDFKQVRFGESNHAELRGLDTRPDQIDLNLMVELTK